MSKDVESLVEQFGIAKDRGAGTDMARLKKELAAQGVNERGKPLTLAPEAETRPAAAEVRAEATEPEAQTEAPRGRVSGRERQSRT